MLLGQRLQQLPLLALGAILLGAGLAAWEEPSFNSATLVWGVAVNVMLTLRNAATKQLLDSR